MILGDHWESIIILSGSARTDNLFKMAFLFNKDLEYKSQLWDRFAVKTLFFEMLP